MELNNFKIYIHENKINHKKYIGQTHQSLTRRFRNGEGYKNNPHFYVAIQKYGWNNFQHKILKENLTLEEANLLQQQLIKQYDTTNPKKGYNISPGGKNIMLSQDISKKNRQRWENGVYDNIKNVVYCVELQQYFESALEAERQLHIDNSSIQKVCRGKIKYAGIINGKPLHWLFQKDVNEKNIQILKNRKQQIKGRSIKRICVETGEIFKSAEQIKKKLNLDPSSIAKACKNPNKTVGGFHWKYYYDEN